VAELSAEFGSQVPTTDQQLEQSWKRARSFLRAGKQARRPRMRRGDFDDLHLQIGQLRSSAIISLPGQPAISRVLRGGAD